MNNFKKWKLVNMILLLTTVILYGGSYFVVRGLCDKSFYCSSTTIESLLLPISQASIWLFVVLLFFLALPHRYFRSFFKYVLWWYVLGVFVLVATIDPHNVGFPAFGRENTVRNYGIILVGIALIFVAVTWWRGRGKAPN